MTTEEERERERLRYIDQSISRIGQYTRGSREVFEADPMVQDAVLRRLETLADAISKLSAGLKVRHPGIPWPQVYGFRNIAVHAYEHLDLSRVWEIVQDYPPDLKVAVLTELGRSGSQ